MNDGMEREIQAIAQIEHMMVDAYDATLGKIHDRALVDALAGFRQRHQEHEGVLRDMAQGAQTQGQFADGGALNRFNLEVLDTIGRSSRQDSAVGELRIAEAALNLMYGQAVASHPQSEEAHTLRECMSEEQQAVSVLSLAFEQART